jgi:hypothetical protein
MPTHATTYPRKLKLFTQALQQHGEQTSNLVLLIVLLLLASLVLRLLGSLVALLGTRVRLLMTTTVAAMARGHDRGPTLEIDVHASGVILGHVLQAEFLTHLLDTGFDLQDVIDGMVPLTNNAMRLLARGCSSKCSGQSCKAN